LNAYRTRGLVYETKGQLANALADFRAAANLDPEKKQIAGKEAAQGIGRVEPKIGAVGGRDWTPCINGPHGEEKIAACTNLIASGKLSGGDLARAYMLRGTSYAILTGDCDRAIPDYTESIKLDPNNVIAHAIRGACLVRKGNFDRALADLNEARRLNSNHVNTRNSFGFYYIARGEYDLALQELNEAIRANPQFLAAYKNRGIAYENKGELSAALSDFRMAVSLDPAQRLLNAREAAQGIARIEQRLAAGRNPEAAAATPVAATPQIPAAVPPPLAVVPGRRFALVIGNDKYESLPVLQKAVNDARAVAERLTRLGFEVILVENATRRAMNEKLTALTGKLGRGDSAFFFFAGHGVAIKDGNYLLPIDTPQAGEGQEGLITREGIAADSIIDALQERGARVVVMVLDACRDNPFKKTGSRGVGGGRGLGEMRAPEGVFVLYSAGFGQSALDRLSDSDPNSNSVFTRTFVRLLEKPGLTLQELAKLAQTEVRRLSGSVNHVQMPAYYDQIDGALALR
jgi:tetratricopeptide (TPR) repeat protein